MYAVLRSRYGDLVQRDYVGAVPGRRYEVDVAHLGWRMGIETDGYRHHGLSKSGWARDRTKDRWLLLNGWLVVRVTNREAMRQPDQVCDMLARLAHVWGRG